MIIMNSPGNPTGSVYSREELQRIAEIAIGEDIVILSDEIYEKLVYGENKHVSVASISKEIYDNTITINGSGFSTTAANNTVDFDNGAVGTVTAATTQALTVTFSTRPTTAGALTAQTCKVPRRWPQTSARPVSGKHKRPMAKA